MAEKTTVLSLSSLTITVIVSECWRRGGAVDELKRHYLNYLSHGSGNIDTAIYYQIITETVRKIITFELPTHLKAEICNRFLEFENEARRFTRFIFMRTHSSHRKNIITSIGHLAVTSSGQIDRKLSLVNAVLRNQHSILITNRYTGYHCVNAEYVQNLLSKENISSACFRSRVRPLELVITAPEVFWRQRQLRDETMPFTQTLFLYTATRGPVEAMNYFLPTLNVDDKDKELSRAAEHLVKRESINVDNIWFFYRNMLSSTWIIFLRRRFHLIMTTLLASYRYRRWAVKLYSDVREAIDDVSIRIVLNYISETHVSDLESQPGGSYLVDQLLDDLESIFRSIWHLIPSSIRYHVAKNVKQHINRFLHRNRFEMISSLVEHETFNEEEQLDLIYHVLMKLIVTKKQSLIDQFLAKLSNQPHLNHESIKSNYLTYLTLKQFIVYGDGCQHVSRYDMLLCTKLADSEITRIKHQLLHDEPLLEEAAQAIKDKGFTLKKFYHLVLWCCGCDTALVIKFVENSLDLMAKVFKNHWLYADTSLYTDDPFYLTGRQMQFIKDNALQDEEEMKAYCSEIMRRKHFSSITSALSCVYGDDYRKFAFLRDFFRSPIGYEAVYYLLSDNESDEGIHYEYDLKNTFSYFKKFLQHWVLTVEIANDVQGILDTYVIPTNHIERVHLLPHETVPQYQNICSINLETMRLHLRTLVNYNR